MDKLKRYVPIILPAVVFAFPAVFLYSKNVREAGLTDMLIPMLTMVALGYALFAVALCVYRAALPAGLFAALFGLVILNYGFFEKIAHRLLPFMRVWQLVPMAAVAIGAVLWLIFARKRAIMEPVALIITLCFAALTVINLVTAIPIEISKLFVPKDMVSELDIKQDKTKSNIYYILLDEYASFSQCENGLGYDNVQMKTFLQDNAFNISYTSVNDSASTEIVMANILQLDYLSKDGDTAAQASAAMTGGVLHDILRKGGYTQRGIGDTDWLGIPSDTIKGEQNKLMTADGEDFWTLLTKNTLFNDANNIVLHSNAPILALRESMDSFDTFKLTPNASQFNMLYLCCPHHPFFFAADGSLNITRGYFNYDGKNTQGYIDQLKYVTTRITASIKRIIKEDPDSIILLCSDHGFRFGTPEQVAENRRILNAVYYKGEELPELEGKSGVNTMRLLLNKELALELPYIDLP